MRVNIYNGEKILRPDGSVIDPFAGERPDDTIPAILSEGCTPTYGGHVSQETLDMLNRATSTVVTSEYYVEFDEED